LNILLLEAFEVDARLPRKDRRWSHVKKILKKQPGDRLAAGLADGPLGEAVIRELDSTGIVLGFEPLGDAPPLAPIRLILGFPRPIQAARILRDLTTLGVSEILLTGTDLGEPSYAQSRFFRDGDFRGHLMEGAEQAGNPRLPRVSIHRDLERCLETLTEEGMGPGQGERILLHPYGDPEPMGGARFRSPITLAVGSERGWSEPELAAFLHAGFSVKGLGGRILKTETAALASCVLALAGLGLI
jgi:RsmE family RNA methyltransferase